MGEPTTMMGIAITEHGGPEVLRYGEIQAPPLAPDGVLVEVRACAVNHLDVWVRMGRRGRHRLDIGLPRIPGSDVCGVIREVGDAVVDPPEVGARVILHTSTTCGRCHFCATGRDNLCSQFSTLGYHRDGGYAEIVATPARDVIPAPAHLSDAEAACLPLVNLTAWNMLVSRAHLRAGEWVLVQAAGSGVGSAAIQLCKALGARVIATASTSAKLGLAERLGADHTIDYTVGFADEVLDITEGAGVDVVVESVGGKVFVDSIRALARGGRITSCGATADAAVALDLHELQGRRASFHFVVMGARGDLREALRVVEAHRLVPALDRELPLDAAAEAHRALESRAHFGKIVLLPPERAR